MKENTDRKAFSMTFFQRFFMGLQRFMAGRRGTDALALATMIVGLDSLPGRANSVGMGWHFPFTAGICPVGYTFFRMLSRNWVKRERENAWFLSIWRPVVGWFSMRRTIWRDRKFYKYFRCPNCRAWQRAPRGKGKIQVRCRGCGDEFFPQKT